MGNRRYSRPGLDEILASASADEPTAADLARLERRLGALLAPPGTGGGNSSDGGTTGSPAPASGSVLATRLASAVITGALAVAGYGVYRAAAPEVPMTSVDLPRLRPPELPSSASSPPAVTPALPSVPSPTPIRDSAGADRARRDGRDRRDRKERRRTEHHRVAAEDLVAEARLLARAEAALRAGAPAQTLTLAEQHADQYRGGSLREERERLAIEALLALGRRSDAETRARRFRATFPDSVQQTRIDELLRATP